MSLKDIDIRLFLYSLANDSTFTLGVFLIYLLAIGLNIAQASIAISTLLISQAISGIPVGIFADTFGYRKAMLVGQASFLLGTILLASGANFFIILLGFFLRGIGFTTKQGTAYAYLYESLKMTNEESSFKARAGKMDFLVNAVWVATSIIGGGLYIFNIRFPVYAEVIIACIGLLSVLTIHELPIVHQGITIVTQVKENLIYAFTTRQFSKIYLFSGLIGSIALLTIQYLQPLYRSLGIPTGIFGIIAAVTFLVRGSGSGYSDKIGKLFSIDKYLVLHSITFGLFLLLMRQLMAVYIVLPIVLIFFFLRGLYNPTISTFINDNVPSERRVTMLTLNNQILSLVTALSLIFTGYISSHYPLQATFYAIGIVSLVFLFAYVLVVRRIEVD